MDPEIKKKKKEANKRWYEKLKADPVRYRKFLDRYNERAKRLYRAKHPPRDLSTLTPIQLKRRQYAQVYYDRHREQILERNRLYKIRKIAEEKTNTVSVLKSNS